MCRVRKHVSWTSSRIRILVVKSESVGLCILNTLYYILWPTTAFAFTRIWNIRWLQRCFYCVAGCEAGVMGSCPHLLTQLLDLFHRVEEVVFCFWCNVKRILVCGIIEGHLIPPNRATKPITFCNIKLVCFPLTYDREIGSFPVSENPNTTPQNHSIQPFTTTPWPHSIDNNVPTHPPTYIIAC